MRQAPAPVQAPRDLEALAQLGPQLAQTFVSMASDVALVVDASGTVIHASSSRAFSELIRGWIGQPWVNTVDSACRHKIEQMLDEIRLHGMARRREINHARAGHGLVPIAYAAIRLGHDGPALAVGRNLQDAAALQKRFLDAQQELAQPLWQPAAPAGAGADRTTVAPVDRHTIPGAPRSPRAPQMATPVPVGAAASLPPVPATPPERPAQVDSLSSAIIDLASQVGLGSLPDLVREAGELAERHLISQALRRASGQIADAARQLGIGPDELRARMRLFGMDSDAPGGDPNWRDGWH